MMTIEQARAYRYLGLAVVLLLGFGTFFYHFQEHFSFVNSFYFCVVTLATVGYGDLVPKTNLGKLVTTAYIFAGVGMIATFFTVTFRKRAEKFQDRQARKSESNS
jgi:voltage-gated potassium channel